MTLQENFLNASADTAEKVLWSPRKVLLIIDRSQLNLQIL